MRNFQSKKLEKMWTENNISIFLHCKLAHYILHVEATKIFDELTRKIYLDF